MDINAAGPCAKVIRVFSQSRLRIIRKSPEDTVITKQCLAREPASLFVSIWRGKITVEAGMTLGQVIDQVCFFLDDREGD